MNKNNRMGKIGEDFAAQYLMSHDFHILARNYRVPYGEIDIIAQKEEVLYFVEVKTRTTNRYGHGFESITPRKIEKIKKTAEQYMVDQGWSGLVKVLCIFVDCESKTSYHIDTVEYEVL